MFLKIFIIDDGLVKSPNYPVLSFLRKSRAPRDYFNGFWTPAFAGVTVSGLFTDLSLIIAK
jgi:hypothetical protein